MPFIELISLHRCRKSGGTFVEKDGHEYAVFLTDGGKAVRVIDNACPHAGGNLAGGHLEGHVVTCPWHHWKFDLTTGVCTHSQQARVCTYRTQVQDGIVCIESPAQRFTDLNARCIRLPPGECGRSTVRNGSRRAESLGAFDVGPRP